jgi:hypothetical protein
MYGLPVIHMGYSLIDDLNPDMYTHAYTCERGRVISHDCRYWDTWLCCTDCSDGVSELSLSHVTNAHMNKMQNEQISQRSRRDQSPCTCCIRPSEMCQYIYLQIAHNYHDNREVCQASFVCFKMRITCFRYPFAVARQTDRTNTVRWQPMHQETTKNGWRKLTVYPKPAKYNSRFLKDCCNLTRMMNCMRRYRIHGDVQHSFFPSHHEDYIVLPDPQILQFQARYCDLNIILALLGN